MASSEKRQFEDENVNRVVRRDSHLALGCGFTFALAAIAALIMYVLVFA